eukprot:jgi/Bigna1/71174/fgenesh1_pg.14_\
MALAFMLLSFLKQRAGSARAITLTGKSISAHRFTFRMRHHLDGDPCLTRKNIFLAKLGLGGNFSAEEVETRIASSTIRLKCNGIELRDGSAAVRSEGDDILPFFVSEEIENLQSQLQDNQVSDKTKKRDLKILRIAFGKLVEKMGSCGTGLDSKSDVNNKTATENDHIYIAYYLNREAKTSAETSSNRIREHTLEDCRLLFSSKAGENKSTGRKKLEEERNFEIVLGTLAPPDDFLGNEDLQMMMPSSALLCDDEERTENSLSASSMSFLEASTVVVISKVFLMSAEMSALLSGGKALGVPQYNTDISLAKGVASGMLSGLKTVISTAFKTIKLLQPVSKMHKSTVDYSITHLVSSTLLRTIAGPLSHEFSEPTASKITELLIPKVTKEMRKFVDKHGEKKSGVPEEVSTRLNVTFSRSIARFAKDKLSRLVSSKVRVGGLDVVDMSSSSSSSSSSSRCECIVARPDCVFNGGDGCWSSSVAVSVSYPTMYCEYCHAQSQQVYYAQYYAGYYSSYYSYYYADFFSKEDKEAGYQVNNAETVADWKRHVLTLQQPSVEYLEYGYGRPQGFLPGIYEAYHKDEAQAQLYSDDAKSVPKYPGVKPK